MTVHQRHCQMLRPWHCLRATVETVFICGILFQHHRALHLRIFVRAFVMVLYIFEASFVVIKNMISVIIIIMKHNVSTLVLKRVIYKVIKIFKKD